METPLIELLNSTLCRRPLNRDTFIGMTEDDWQQCFDHALQQNVLAMTFPSMSSLPKELRPSFLLWSKWMAYAQSVVGRTETKRNIVKKIGSWLVEDGLSTTILKGFALSVLYPHSNLREFSDIDIFSGDNFDMVNECLAKHGVMVIGVDGHHAYLKMDGVSVEHHFAFSNTRVKNGLAGPEELLQHLILTDQRPTTIPGVFFPNPLFNTLFVGWHAYEHFLQEKINLRHVIDWVLSLRRLTCQELKTLETIKSGTGYGLFVDTLTAIAIRQLNLPQEWFSTKDIISFEQGKKVWDDIMYAPRTPKSKSSSYRRILIAKRILKNNWKYKKYSNISSSQLLIKEIAGHLKSLYH